MNNDLVLGIDEAGRGPGIGPMVLAAVALDKTGTAFLARAGVRDSKAFGSGAAGRQRRAELASVVHQHAAWCAVEICEVSEIDEHVAQGRRIIADGRTLFSALASDFAQLEAHDRAESLHLAVAAASVCAKALRDELFAAIAGRYRSEFGELGGGGYVNPATCAFVAEHVRRTGRLPEEARKSWPWHGIARPVTDELAPTALPWPRVR
jgi:ribonuclease HII